MLNVQNNLGGLPALSFPTFMGCDLSWDFHNDALDVVVTGVPFDLATTVRPGTRFGPAAIRQATAHLDWELCRWPWEFRVFDKLRAIDCGDLSFDPTAGEQMVAGLQAHAAHILAAGKTMLTLGGDHFITLPLLRAHAQKHGPLALIHFDAHADREKDQGPLNHGSMFYHAVQEGLLSPERSVQIGIRTEHDRTGHKFTVLDAGWVMDHNADAVIKEIRQVVGDCPAYLTFDIDCLDPAFAPGTGTPVVGGLSTDLALRIMRGLVGCKLVGMDIVEVSPPYDHAEITSLAAATLGLEFLYVLAANRKRHRT
ncbi:MAG: agmatinase [Desulfobacteraceae bacterium]|nr:agmatinase [Desulfobacteraceae bacterium]